MGKKKLSLKPVIRGFATTSVAKKVEKPVEESKEEVDDAPPPKVPTHDEGGGQQVTEDWEEEKSSEDIALQNLVERLHEKAEKEVSRVVKAIEFDKRLAKSWTSLEINREVRDRVLQLALEDEEGQAAPSFTSSSSSETDKAYIRVFITYHVLTYLGLTEDRIQQYFSERLGENDGWEEAVEWMWLHLEENECLSLGRFAKQPAAALPEIDGPLEDLRVPAQVSEPAVTPVEEPIVTETERAPAAEPISLFSAAAESDSEESDHDEQISMTKENELWASLMLKLDNLRNNAGQNKKGRKGKNQGVVIDTPEIHDIKKKIAQVEKEYLFSRKEADQILKSSKAKRDATALAQRLKGDQGASASIPVEVDVLADASVDDAEEDEEGGLFGNMLDEPNPTAVQQETNTSITVRPMPIPKQFTFAGNTPKALLKTAIGKSSKEAIITYACLSGASRAARAGVEIRWSTSRRRVWRMDDIACDDMAEAENYVSTLVLSELTFNGDFQAQTVNWRAMPPAYRDLWEELGMAKKEQEGAEKRKVWARIKAVVESKRTTANGVEAPVVEAKTTNVFKTIKRERDTQANPKLQADFEKRTKTPAYQFMRQQRDGLPIASFREQILATIESSQIMVLSGETGCGKSTQLPSFILEDQLAKGRSCKIFVTEPRRISAISLAQRVSQELGDAPGTMGTNNSLVGYSIRLESKVSPSTRLAFVTNGIALRMLESGSNGSQGTAFDEVTHIVIDEVHERSIESDFLLIVLKSLVEQRKDLKVILMSATLDAEKISGFFGGCPYLAVPGRTFPVQVNYLEDAVEAAGWHIDETSPYAIRPRNAKAGGKQLEWTEESAKPDDEDEEEYEADPTKLSGIKYSSRTVSTVNLLDSRQIPYDLIVRLLERVCFEDDQMMRFSTATLVFMPGLAEIRKLNDMLLGHPAFGSQDFVIHPLHSTVSSEGQSAVFDIPSPGIRKIVISTNIAETGVTIPDITCVIDSGKHREMRYDEKRQLSRLVETYIARSNAKQRRGRAGRVQEGLAFHLFTKARHDIQLAEHPIPEMLRLSLQDLALRIKILKIKLGNSIEDVLMKALDPPSQTNIQRAIAALVEVKALTTLEEITPMGRLLSKLPMDVHLGKFLLVAALFKCLDPALTIAATLNSKSPFVTPFGFEHAADAAKRAFAVGNSDFLTIVNVFDSWRRASDTPNFVRTFCKRNFVSQQNLQQIEELRQQLLAYVKGLTAAHSRYLVDSSFVDASQADRQAISRARFSRGVRTRFVTVPAELNVNAGNAQILSSALASGLYPKILNIEGDAIKTIVNQQPVSIHPSSINFRAPKSDFGTNYLTYFTIMQSKRLYAWETGPVDDRALALLCGDQADFRLPASSLQIDRKIRYHVEPKTALAIKGLRNNFALAMSARLRGRQLNTQQQKWFELGLECLKTGIWAEPEQSVGVL